jgi:hypothetical protein
MPISVEDEDTIARLKARAARRNRDSVAMDVVDQVVQNLLPGCDLSQPREPIDNDHSLRFFAAGECAVVYDKALVEYRLKAKGYQPEAA